MMLAQELAVDVPEYQPYQPDVPQDMKSAEIYPIPYDEKTGVRLADETTRGREAVMTTLDLREGAEVKLTGGPHAGMIGTVAGKDGMGHYNISVKVRVKGDFFTPWPMTLGSWWVESAVKGLAETVCVVPHNSSGAVDPSYFHEAKRYAHVMRKERPGIDREALLADLAVEGLDVATFDALLQRRESDAHGDGAEAAEEGGVVVTASAKHQALVERVAGWLEEGGLC